MLKKKLSILLMSAFFVTLFTGQSLAAQENDKKVKTEKVLKAAKDNEVDLDKVIFTEYEDETNKISVTDTKKTDDAADYYQITVDKEKETYKAKRLKITDEIKKEVESTSQSLKINSKFRKLFYTKNELSTLATPYNVTALLVSEDPVQADLAKTKVYLNWTVNYYGNPVLGTHGITPQPINPTIFGTHWYLQSSSNNTPTVGASNITKVGSATYYNYDFRDTSLKTTTYHYLKVIGWNDGTYTYTSDKSSSGEYSSLIVYDLFVNGSQIY